MEICVFCEINWRSQSVVSLCEIFFATSCPDFSGEDTDRLCLELAMPIFSFTAKAQRRKGFEKKFKLKAKEEKKEK